MGATETQNAQRRVLLRLIDESFNRAAWHGTNLRGSIRRVSVQQAGWRPAKRRHNIAEIVLHCAYWKYAVKRRITGGKRGSFLLKGSDWFVVAEDISAGEWKQYVSLLDDMHRALREAVADAPWSALTKGPGGDARTPAAHVRGIAMHDLYHAGQIQTLKALQKR